MSRPTTAFIEASALQHNISVIRARVRGNVNIMPVIKANAYGHGADIVVRALQKSGIGTFCVAQAEEALDLIEKGIKADYIVLGGIYPDEVNDAVAHDLIPVISDEEILDQLNRAAKAQNKKVRMHLKIDSGMGRLGVTYQEGLRYIDRISSLSNLVLDGILSHLSRADHQHPEDVKYTQSQIVGFSLFQQGIIRHRADIRLWHLANSAGVWLYPASHFNAVRPGIIIYGASPFPEVNGRTDIPVCQNGREHIPVCQSVTSRFLPVMSIESEIVMIKRLPQGSSISYGGVKPLPREGNVAVVPIGYADGIPRNLPLDFSFLVGGKKAPLAGVVTMDMIMLDLTEIPQAKKGDKVTILGKQGDLAIRAEDIAGAAGMIVYEFFTGIFRRVKRVESRNDIS